MRTPTLASLLLLAACGGAAPQPAPLVDTADPGAPEPVMAARPDTTPSGAPRVTLTRGLAPDPMVFEGTLQGTVNREDVECVGSYAGTPSLVVVVPSPMGLRFVVNADSDTTLRIRSADGVEHCNDDSEQLHPAISVPNASGTYEVWVGSYSEGAAVAYSLGVSENFALMPSQIPGPPGALAVPQTTPPPDVGTQSNFGTVSLSPGSPPHTTRGIAGPEGDDRYDVSSWDPECVGFARGTPNHVFIAQQDFRSLTIAATSDTDTTLIVQRPDGTFICNDDTNGLDPAVTSAMPQGTYKIWVGIFGSEAAPYTLEFSEPPSDTPQVFSPVT